MDFDQHNFYCTILNHPDQYFDRLKNAVDNISDKQRLNWTFRQVAQWFRATHCSDKLKIERFERRGKGPGYLISASDHLEDLELRLLCPMDHNPTIRLVDGRYSIEPQWTHEVIDGLPFIRIRLDLKAEKTLKLSLEIQ